MTPFLSCLLLGGPKARSIASPLGLELCLPLFLVVLKVRPVATTS